MMADSTTFLASFPPIQSAFKRHGGGDGMRIQLDIPESELHNALVLQQWTRRPLRVTVEALPDVPVYGGKLKND